MNKNSLNNTIVKVVTFTLWIILIFIMISSLILWQKTNDFVFIISGLLSILGVLFNIYLASRAKSEKD